MGHTMPNDSTSEFIVSDAVTDLEDRFPFGELLSLDYFQRHRAGTTIVVNTAGRFRSAITTIC